MKANCIATTDERSLAVELAVRYLNGDHRVRARFDGEVRSELPEGEYFALAQGGGFAFTDDDWETSFYVAWEALVQPTERSAAAAAALLAELGRRSDHDFAGFVREIDQELLAEYAVAGGGIDGALSALRPKSEVAPADWQQARSHVYQALFAVLASVDSVGDAPELGRELRALMVLESYRSQLEKNNCGVCFGRSAQLAAPRRGENVPVCAPCFIGVRYLPRDHETLTERERRELSCQLAG
jgi:hypothetical protein